MVTLTDMGGGLLLGHGLVTDHLMREHAVTHILHVAADASRGDEATLDRSDDQTTLEYLSIDLTDLASTVETAVVFVRSAMEADGIVVVRSTVDSHSTAVTTAVLMVLHGWSLSIAWTHVISRQDCSLEQDGRRALLEFEVTTRGSPSMIDDEGGQKLTKPTKDYVDTGSEASGTDKDVDSSSSDSEYDQIDVGRKQASKEAHAAAAERASAPAAEEDCPPATAAADDGAARSGAPVCDRCDGPHLSEACPYFTKPREAPPAAGEVRYDDESEQWSFNCPHCEELVTVHRRNLACRTFRHAVPKPDANQRGVKGRLVGGFANPHAPREECERWVREGLIFGCGKPFRFNGKKVEACGYV